MGLIGRRTASIVLCSARPLPPGWVALRGYRTRTYELMEELLTSCRFGGVVIYPEF